jgi:hypothetical protein
MVAIMSLHNRCTQWIKAQQDDPGISREMVQDLADFVRTEIGRAADLRLEDAAPLVLYFTTEQDRAEFLAAVHEAKPGMIARKWP